MSDTLKTAGPVDSFGAQKARLKDQGYMAERGETEAASFGDCSNVLAR